MSDNFDFSWDSMSSNLQKNITTSSEKKSYSADSRFWKISKDDKGIGTAIIRFLPDKNKLMFAQIYHYSLQKEVAGKKWYYIANSPESINLPCPVKEHFNALMEENTAESKEMAVKNFKRQIKYFANILVVKDPANPENNGKVFLYEFGTKFKDKLVKWMNPSEDEIDLADEPEDADSMTAEEILKFKKESVAKRIFNPVNGHNVKLKAAPNGTMINGRAISVLDDSEAMPNACPAVDKLTGANAMKWLEKNTYDLNEFLSPEFYESYDELKKRFDMYVNGGSKKDSASSVVASKATIPDEDEDWDESPKTTTVKESSTVKVEDDDDSWMDDIV